MGFPEIHLPKLYIHALFSHGYIRAIVFSLFSFLGLSHFLETESHFDQENQLPEPPVSAVLIRELLPVIKFSGLDPASITGEGDQPESCAVCLNEFEGDDDIRCLLNCKHTFHKCCLDRWMDHGSKTCPYCRKHLVPPHLVEEFNQRLWEEYYINPDFCIEDHIFSSS